MAGKGFALGAAMTVLSIAMAGCGAPGTTRLTILSLSTMSAAPSSVVTVHGTGLDLGSSPALLFETGSQYSWTVPALNVRAAEADFPVPAYVSGSHWGAGDVEVRLVQGQERSDPVAGFHIQALPTSPLPAGFLTWAVVDGIHDYAASLGANVSQLGSAQGGASSAALVANLKELADGLRAVQQGTSDRLDLGGLNGRPFLVNASVLAETDRLLMAWLTSPGLAPRSSVSEKAAIGLAGFAVGLAAADASCAAGKNFEISLRVEDYLETNEGPYARHLKNVVGGAPCASNEALEVVAASGAVGASGLGALGVSETALLLPSVALSSITSLVAGWQVALGMHLRGLHDTASKALLEDGIDNLDKQMGQTLEDLVKALKPLAKRPEGTLPGYTPPSITETFPQLELANKLFKDGCAMAAALVDLKCPKWEVLWSKTPTPTSTAFTSAASGGTFTGTLAGRWGRFTSTNGCTTDVSFSGPFTLKLTAAGDGDAAGTGDTALTVTWTIVDSHGGMCSSFQEPAAATGALTGSPSSFSGTLHGSDGYALAVKADGSVSGSTAHVAGSVTGTLWTQDDRSDQQTKSTPFTTDLARG